MSSPASRPLPVPDEQSAPFWQAAARGELCVAQCRKCGQVTFPPDMTCPHCHTTDPDFAFVPVSGRGRVRTWTVIRRSYLQGFESPFVLVDVELEDHPDLRIVARLLDGEQPSLAVGAAVTAQFEELAPGVCVPAFKLEPMQ